MPTKTLTLPLWDQKVSSGDPDAEARGIRKEPRDWRDPDKYLQLDPGGVRSKVYSRDDAYNSHRGSVEPDWELGWYVMLQDGSGKILMEFKGPCPSPFRESLLEGRELVGVIIARDFQQHS